MKGTPSQRGPKRWLGSRWVRRRYYIEDGHLKPVLGSAAEEYDPFEFYDRTAGDAARRSLHVELASLNPDALVEIEAFASRWGLLGLFHHDRPPTRYERAGPGESLAEPLDSFREAAREFQEIYRLCVARSRARGLASVDRDLVQDQFEFHLQDVRDAPIYVPTDSSGPENDSPEATTSRFVPGTWRSEWVFPSLLAAAYKMLALDITQNRNFRFCAREGCRNAFVTDRSDRVYCSKECLNVQKQRDSRQRKKEAAGTLQ